MPWTALSAEALKSQLSAQELEALRTFDLAAGQGDPLTEVLLRTVLEVRGYIPALRPDLGAAAGLLPDTLHGATVDMVRYRLCSRLASGPKAAAWLLTEPRTKAYEQAIYLLKDVARGLVAVEPPPTSTPSAAPPPYAGDFGGDDSYPVASL
jgi:hypothetical protein